MEIDIWEVRVSGCLPALELSILLRTGHRQPERRVTTAQETPLFTPPVRELVRPAHVGGGVHYCQCYAFVVLTAKKAGKKDPTICTVAQRERPWGDSLRKALVRILHGPKRACPSIYMAVRAWMDGGFSAFPLFVSNQCSTQATVVQ